LDTACASSFSARVCAALPGVCRASTIFAIIPVPGLFRVRLA
jgi:hypothetical protein